MGIDEQIDEYFSKEKNLRCLREKLFKLDGYRHQSDVDEEISKLHKENERIVENIKKKHQKALEKLVEEHRMELRQMETEYEKRIKQKEKELDDFRDYVDGTLKEVVQDREKLTRWQFDYGDFAKAYANFSVLSQKHKDAIAGIFGGCDTPMDFFCGSVQKGHLEQLWDYIRDELDNNDIDEQEADRLSNLFEFSFNAVNRSQREPLFKRLAVYDGVAFDGDTMGRTADSPQLGQVQRLVFAGFAHNVTGSIVRRSLVKLG